MPYDLGSYRHARALKASLDFDIEFVEAQID
jgi:hypothetical protein